MITHRIYKVEYNYRIEYKCIISYTATVNIKMFPLTESELYTFYIAGTHFNNKVLWYDLSTLNYTRSL